MTKFLVVATFVLSVCGALGCAATSDMSGGGFGGAGSGGFSGFGGNGGVAGNGGTGGFGGFGGTAGSSGFGGFSGAAGTGGIGGSAGVGGGLEPVAIDECGPNNPGGLTPTETQQLLAGGSAGNMRWLYPYEGTVFPRGTLPPVLAWDGHAATLVYLHISANDFDYKGCYRIQTPGDLSIPGHVWDAVSEHTRGPSDPYTFEITTLDNGQAQGPLARRIIVAQATLKGSIYYNSYVSMGSNQGAVYRIPPGGIAETFLGMSGCTGCHSLSANGTRMVSHGGLTGLGAGNSYALTPTTQPNPPANAMAANAGFVGMYPDGSMYLASARPAGVVKPQGTPIEDLFYTHDAILYETDTGTVIANTGIPAGAMMPTFSPDGSLLVFNDFAISSGRGLAIMGFDRTTRRADNRRVIHTDTDRYPGWPFVLPDNGGVVFARGTHAGFPGAGAGTIPGATFAAPQSDLYIVDVQSGTSTLLARAMGFDTPQSNTTYLPEPNDTHKHYYPTVSPVAAGGYFWIFFDSIRSYGHFGVARQLWGAAITVSSDGRYQGDPSHPAFFVPGQVFGTGNHRAFTALDPCRADGQACDTGVDCCGGFCTDNICGRPSVPRCSQTNEACTRQEDCCDPYERCIAGYCSELIPE